MTYGSVLMNYICLPVLMCLCFVFSGGQHGAVQPFSDEDASIETLSHCSSFSDATSVADEGRFVCTPDCTLFERVFFKHIKQVCLRPP